MNSNEIEKNKKNWFNLTSVKNWFKQEKNFSLIMALVGFALLVTLFALGVHSANEIAKDKDNFWLQDDHTLADIGMPHYVPTKWHWMIDAIAFAVAWIGFIAFTKRKSKNKKNFNIYKHAGLQFSSQILESLSIILIVSLAIVTMVGVANLDHINFGLTYILNGGVEGFNPNNAYLVIFFSIMWVYLFTLLYTLIRYKKINYTVGGAIWLALGFAVLSDAWGILLTDRIMGLQRDFSQSGEGHPVALLWIYIGFMATMIIGVSIDVSIRNMVSTYELMTFAIEDIFFCKWNEDRTERIRKKNSLSKARFTQEGLFLALGLVIVAIGCIVYSGEGIWAATIGSGITTFVYWFVVPLGIRFIEPVIYNNKWTKNAILDDKEIVIKEHNVNAIS